MHKPLEELVIDPTPEQLVALLDRATRKANGRLREWRLDQDAAAWRRFVRQHATTRDGRDAFLGNRSEAPAARVTVAWWTDSLGRRHWRVRGGRTTVYDRFARLMPLDAYPVWHVYPGRLLLRERDSKRELVALCGCGEAGPLAAIGWVGTRCGPCHDRREDGHPYAGPIHPAELPGDGGEVVVLDFTPDGRLVRGNRSARVVSWDPATGDVRSLLARRDPSRPYLWLSSAGDVVVQRTQHRRLAFARLDDDPIQWRVQRVADGCGDIMGMDFTPDGRSLLVRGTGGLFLVDPAGETPPRPLDRGWAIVNIGFLDAGRLALAFDVDEGVVRLDLATGERVPLHPRPRPAGERRQDRRHMAFMASGFQGLFSARSPDGEWLACEGRWVDSPQPHLYHVPTGRWLPLPCGDHGVPPVLGFTRRGELLTIHEKGNVAVWDVTERTLVGKLQLDDPLDTSPVALSPDGEYLAAVADYRGTVRLWPWRRLLGLSRE